MDNLCNENQLRAGIINLLLLLHKTTICLLQLACLSQKWKQLFESPLQEIHKTLQHYVFDMGSVISASRKVKPAYVRSVYNTYSLHHLKFYINCVYNITRLE